MNKKIEMKVTRCGNTGWVEDGTKIFNRVSRWIEVKQNYNPCPRNSRWYYVQDENGYKPHENNFNPENGLYLDYFSYHGRNYAIEQFLSLSHPFYLPVSYSYNEGGKQFCLSGVDGENIYNPLYIEMDETGEYVRIYEEV